MTVNIVDMKSKSDPTINKNIILIHVVLITHVHRMRARYSNRVILHTSS